MLVAPLSGDVGVGRDREQGRATGPQGNVGDGVKQGGADPGTRREHTRSQTVRWTRGRGPMSETRALSTANSDEDVAVVDIKLSLAVRLVFAPDELAGHGHNSWQGGVDGVAHGRRDHGWASPVSGSLGLVR